MIAGHKYHAERTLLDGHTFASKGEAGRYAELKLLVRAGLIRDLTLQPAYALYACVGGSSTSLSTVGFYVADFEYVTCATAEVVTEDFKGVRTAIYRWKKRHFELQYGRRVTEVGGKSAQTAPPRRRGGRKPAFSFGTGGRKVGGPKRVEGL